MMFTYVAVVAMFQTELTGIIFSLAAIITSLFLVGWFVSDFWE